MTNKLEISRELATLIIRDICEHEPDDNPDAAHISVKSLELILLQRLEDIAAPGVERQEAAHKCQKCYGLGLVPTRKAGEGETEYRARCKLYAEQPAPVAVVLPSPDDLRYLISRAAKHADLTNGANFYTAAELAAEALIDKVKELNQ